MAQKKLKINKLTKQYCKYPRKDKIQTRPYEARGVAHWDKLELEPKSQMKITKNHLLLKIFFLISEDFFLVFTWLFGSDFSCCWDISVTLFQALRSSINY